MRETRTRVPSAAQKRAAADSFRGYDPDATDSSTESESETERLERYPAKRRPSPRQRSGRMLERLRDEGRHASGKKAMKMEMEDEGKGLAVRTRRTHVKEREAMELEVMPRVLPSGVEVDDDDVKPGSGQVFVDGEVSKRRWDAVMRARRAVMQGTEPEVETPNIPKSDMGLFTLLPGELRNRIYRFALVEGDDEPFLVSMAKETCNLGPCGHMKMPTAVPGILSACKQIRGEAMPIFVAENSFKFDAELVKARCVANWLRVIGPYGELLSKVVLDIVCWEVPVNSHPRSTQKVGVHYEMVLQWERVKGEGRWTLDTAQEIAEKAASEYSVLDTYVDRLSKKVKQGTAKEVALREFVWSDWLAKLVYVCRK